MTNKKKQIVNCWPSGKYVHLLYMYSILGRGSFCFNYCLNSAWHGGDQFMALLRWYGSPSFFDSGLLFICIFGLLFLNTGLQATWAMSFSTLPPDSRTLVSKRNTKLALIWKEDFGPLRNSPVLLLLSPSKTPLTTTVAKFLDTSVCGGSWCLDPSLSPFFVKFIQILKSILLDNLHKAAILSVGCASFSSALFPSTQLSVNMLGYSTMWTAIFFGNECLWLALLVKGVNDCLMDNCQISSFTHDCVA